MRVSNSTPLRLLATLTALAFASPVLADDFPPGEACAFGIDIGVTVGHANNFRTFFDRDGNLIRVLLTGNSPELVITNTSSGASYKLNSRGQRQEFTIHPDGTATYTATGHTLLIWAPADEPGPAVIAYVGRIVADINVNNEWTLRTSTGKEIDVCELLE